MDSFNNKLDCEQWTLLERGEKLKLYSKEWSSKRILYLQIQKKDEKVVVYHVLCAAFDTFCEKDDVQKWQSGIFCLVMLW